MLGSAMGRKGNLYAQAMPAPEFAEYVRAYSVAAA